ncbi:hypothetical protein U1Q18_048604, partial [Sarracenia purpurea var. burkii]
MGTVGNICKSAYGRTSQFGILGSFQIASVFPRALLMIVEGFEFLFDRAAIYADFRFVSCSGILLVYTVQMQCCSLRAQLLMVLQRSHFLYM